MPPFEILRDPLWNNIRLDPLAVSLIDTPAFQRLRYVRQLGLAFLVYPGATHSRFEHALGTFHLARRALSLLDERGELAGISADDCMLIRVAALLHDIGHYPFSHALEEIGALHHEQVARPLIAGGAIGDLLRTHVGVDAPEHILALVGGDSAHPLQRLISGSLDLDKLDYLRRDAFMCGVSYGEIDVDRLLNSLEVMPDPVTGTTTVGILEKGLSALESLLFARYQMYRNVYWHHAVRAATAMYKRLVAEALDAGALDAAALASFTDEGILGQLHRESPSPLLTALSRRALYKRAFECPAAELDRDAAEWMADDHGLAVAAENALAQELGLAPGELLLDFPTKTQMLALDIPVRLRDGGVRRLTTEGRRGAIDLPKLSDELYRSARWLRVFTRERTSLPAERVLRFAHLDAADVRRRIQTGTALLD
jgi:HD superfamily phosphohydrolase